MTKFNNYLTIRKFAFTIAVISNQESRLRFKIFYAFLRWKKSFYGSIYYISQPLFRIQITTLQSSLLLLGNVSCTYNFMIIQWAIRASQCENITTYLVKSLRKHVHFPKC